MRSAEQKPVGCELAGDFLQISSLSAYRGGEWRRWAGGGRELAEDDPLSDPAVGRCREEKAPAIPAAVSQVTGSQIGRAHV